MAHILEIARFIKARVGGPEDVPMFLGKSAGHVKSIITARLCGGTNDRNEEPS